MLNHIQSLEKLSNRARGEYIKHQLTQWGVPFLIQNFRNKLIIKGENIIVDYPFGQSPSKFTMVTAHYNKYLSSPGANDNGSGVAILLELIKKLKRENPEGIKLRLVFFDHEDGIAVLAGSGNYLKKFGTEAIKELYNIDQVGMGEIAVLWPSEFGDESKWQQKYIERLSANGLEVYRMPHAAFTLPKPIPVPLIVSDHYPFIKSGFKQAVSLAVYPSEDKWILDLVRDNRITQALLVHIKHIFNKKSPLPKISRHYHNKHDLAKYLDESTLNKVYKAIWETITNRS